MGQILITGTAGFIGMHAAIRFLREGWNVIGLDNLNSYYDTSLKEKRLVEISKVAATVPGEFLFHKADLCSTIWEELRQKDLDAVLHLAAQAGVRYSLVNPGAYLDSNVLGFQRVLDFVRDEQISRFIYASSSSVYGMDTASPFSESAACTKPESYYAATKRTNELLAHAYKQTYGISSIGLRFFTVYGPWGRPDMAPYLFTKAAYDNTTIQVFNNGDQHRDFTYIDDIIQGIFLLFEVFRSAEMPEIVNIGRGKPVGLMDFISNIEKHTRTVIDKVYVPAQPGDVKYTFADTTLITGLTGYTPSKDLDEGVSQLVAWFKSYHRS